jgi:hypothetical protein
MAACGAQPSCQAAAEGIGSSMICMVGDGVLG